MTRASKLFLTAILLAPILALAQTPQKSFDGLSCQSNIEQELQGRQMPNEPVSNTEARYKSLGLKDNGADEIRDQLNAVIWRICGDQYVLLQKKDRVQAVLKVPQQYRNSGDLINCVAQDKAKLGYYLAVPAKGRPGSAQAAWMLDEKNLKFVAADPAKLECER